MRSSLETFDVLTVGEPMTLFTALDRGPLEGVREWHRSVAGAELNVAIGLARLGLMVGYLSRVGQDSFGRGVLAALAHDGVSSALVRVDATRRTGFMLKAKAVSGADPAVEYHRAGSAASHLSVADAPGEGCRYGWLHLTGVAAAVMARTVNALSAQADLVLPGLAEGRLLTGLDRPEEIAAWYLDHGARQVVIKLGPQGAYFAEQGGVRGHVPGVAVAKVVDTVGAGDGFAVGVISGLVAGLSLEQAAERGNRIGARVVQFPGDSDGLPTRLELDS